jgi:hypothetical protein
MRRKKERPVSNSNEIVAYLHCKLCLEEKPDGVSPQQWASMEVGWTPQGLQVWCKRHDCNMLHVDFLGQTLPANTTRKRFTKEEAAEYECGGNQGR